MGMQYLDAIARGPAILFACVKCWHVFACKESSLVQQCIEFGSTSLFWQTEHAQAAYTLLFILSPRRTSSTLVDKSPDKI